MKTLCFIAYVIISLLIARHKYWDLNITADRGLVNPCYMNSKKSLRYGFLFLPVLIVSVYSVAMILIGLGKLFVLSVIWILTNMP